MTLSPQTSTQVDGFVQFPPVHDQPATFALQLELHFEELEVSPSSQNSPGITHPSPQIGVQV